MLKNDNVDNMVAKAWAFFERARKVAQSNNFDYAIEMYLEGLRCAPDEVQDGHTKLHELALLRQVKGGKKPSMGEKIKRMRGKNPLEQMLNAEYLFAKDPDHLPYAEAILKASIEGDYKRTAWWIADFVFAANNAAQKPSFQTYLLLRDSYAAISKYDRALAACQRACKLKPEDAELADQFQKLSAELTVSKGKYDQGGDFRNSIKNREAQEKLQSQDAVVKTVDYRQTAIKDARKALAKDPSLPRNIFNLAKKLSEMQTDEAENEAIALLEKAYTEKNDFSFKQQAGLTKIKQVKRKIRASGDQPSDLAEQLENAELDHYKLCVENYPTDLPAKFELGMRMMNAKQYDQAIPLFQEAQKDPRHKIVAISKIGLCFYMKGWFADAADIFTQAIDNYEMKDDALAKELRYNLARAHEHQNNFEQALDIYRKIAQLDFAYKDVRQRIDKIRNKSSEQNSQ